MLGLILCISAAFAQTRTVTGTVTSAEDGQPVIAASVVVKGATSIGVVTDLDGKFVLNGVPSSATTLIVSSIGMLTKEVPVAATVNVVLEPDSEVLEEAVVTIAYGAAKKSSLTGAIAQVNSEVIQNRPTSTVASALEGHVAGVQINSTYGAAGSDPSIYIRGIGTINGTTSPLYILDGVPYGGNMADLNPADIESISILKDAASAALYGNRASNGVVLITTKKGQQGRISMTLDVKRGTFNRGIPEYELANDREWMHMYWTEMKNERINAGLTEAEAKAYANENIIPGKVFLNIYNKADNALFDANGFLVADAKIKDPYKDDLDWYKAGLRHGLRQEYNLSGSGATDRSDYLFSFGYLDENGYVVNDGWERYSGRATANMRPNSWFKAGLNLNATYQKYHNTNGDSADSFTNLFMYARNIAPVYPIHLHDVNTGEYILDANGDKQYDGGEYMDANGAVIKTRNQYPDRHVLWENDLNKDITTRSTVNATAYTEFYFLKDFTFTVTGNLNVRSNVNKTYNSAVIGDGKSNNGRGSRTEYIYKNWQLAQHLRWTHQFGDHSVNLLAGHENYSYEYLYMYSYKTNQVMPGKNTLRNFTEITSLYDYNNYYKTESYLGRARYNYKDKYNVEASFRLDGSSRFHPDTRWGAFWSVGANWMVSKEDFMQNYPWINSLKLRADYGEVGNDASAGLYAYQALYSAAQNANKGAYYISQLEAQDLQWETSASWGIGIESRLFNRLNFNIEYFDKRNRDLIFDVYNPLSAGATSTSSAESTITKNIGTISNRGIEIEADVDVFKNRDWRINIGANATFMKNKVVELPEENREDGILSGTKRIMEGKDRYAFWLYTFEGVDQMTGRSLYKFDDEACYIPTLDANGEIVRDGDGNPVPAFGTLVNADGGNNTMVSAENFVIINGVPYVLRTAYAKKEWHGSSLAKVFGSFNLNASWKNLSFSALFTYALGGKVYDGVYAGLMSLSGNPSSQHRDLMKAWDGVPAGMTETSADRIDPNGVPVINSAIYSDNNAGTTSRWLRSGNYLVIKNIALSYKFPKQWAKAIDVQGITLNATVENLKTFTALKGMNPQQGMGGTQANYLVTPRVYSVGLNVRF